jgi:hypothetical protein
MASIAAQYALQNPQATGHALAVPTSIGCICLCTLLAVIFTLVYRKKHANKSSAARNYQIAMAVFWTMCAVCACCASLNMVVAVRSL